MFNSCRRLVVYDRIIYPSDDDLCILDIQNQGNVDLLFRDTNSLNIVFRNFNFCVF